MIDVRAEALTDREAAKILNVHPLTVFNMRKDGRLPYFRIGRAVRIPRAAVESILRGELDCGDVAVNS